MGWHVKSVHMSTSLVSVWHWPLMGVDYQKIIIIIYNPVEE
jgi:hypothetical protein